MHEKQQNIKQNLFLQCHKVLEFLKYLIPKFLWSELVDNVVKVAFLSSSILYWK